MLNWENDLQKFQKKQKQEKKLERETQNATKNWDIDLKYVVGGVTILDGIFGIYFAWKRDKCETKMENKLEKMSPEKNEKVVPKKIVLNIFEKNFFFYYK